MTVDTYLTVIDKFKVLLTELKTLINGIPQDQDFYLFIKLDGNIPALISSIMLVDYICRVILWMGRG